VHENEKVSHEDRLYGFYQYLRTIRITMEALTEALRGL
jgi:hypothetical protein